MLLKKIAIGLAMLTMTAAPALASNKRVTVHVDGLACPFCTYNLEKRIKTLDAVAAPLNWEASVEEGTASFDWKADVPFDEDAVREQIRKAGFTPGKVEVSDGTEDKEQSIAGKVMFIDDEESGEQMQMINPETEHSITLQSAERLDRLESYSRLLAYVKKSTGEDESVTARVYGLQSSDKEDQFILHRWEPARFGAAVMLNLDELHCQRCSISVMRTVPGVEGVIHVEADHEQDRVQVWTESDEPDTDAIRKAIEDAGFKVTHVHAMPAKEAEKTQ